MLVQYDRAMKALSTALASHDLPTVLKGREELELIKVRAKQLRDRQLLADAVEFQARVERWLGSLLSSAKASGKLVEGRPRKESNGFRLSDIGIDGKLSMHAQRAAAMSESVFEANVARLRSQITVGNGRRAYIQRRSGTPADAFDHRLCRGLVLGDVRIAKLRSLIAEFEDGARILLAIAERLGGDTSADDTVRDVISARNLQSIISGEDKLNAA